MTTLKKRDGLFIGKEFSLLIYGFVLSLKCLLIRCYHSTDFEVHRNWMAITHNLPLSEWYYSSVSEWTLDYPPFFAYLEWLLAAVAARIDVKMLTLQREAYFSKNALLFQRFSVIVLDAFYAFACHFLSKHLLNFGKKLTDQHHHEMAFFALLLLNPVLILLDNVHFQYNAFMYGFLFVAIGLVIRQRHLMHIFLYYVPAFAFFYAYAYLLPVLRVKNFHLATALSHANALATVLALPIFLAFGPFFYFGGLDGVSQIITRLFPFRRGLTHAYWAPNAWALYNFVDFALYKTLSKNSPLMGLIAAKNGTLSAPQYTRGLVVEYAHIVLPNITPAVTLVLIGLFCLPIILLLKQKHFDKAEKFLASLTLSAFAFFVFGWHVHEKAVLMIFFPMLLLTFRNQRYFAAFEGLTVSAVFAPFPLFFTPLENALKLGVCVGYLLVHGGVFRHVFRVSSRSLTTRYALLLAALDVYQSFIHKAIFGTSASFLPLLLFSVVCSLGVSTSYFQLFIAIFSTNSRLKIE